MEKKHRKTLPEPLPTFHSSTEFNHNLFFGPVMNFLLGFFRSSGEFKVDTKCTVEIETRKMDVRGRWRGSRGEREEGEYEKNDFKWDYFFLRRFRFFCFHLRIVSILLAIVRGIIYRIIISSRHPVLLEHGTYTPYTNIRFNTNWVQKRPNRYPIKSQISKNKTKKHQNNLDTRIME